MQPGPVTTRVVLQLALPAALGAWLQHAFRPVDQYFAQFVSGDAQGALGASTFVTILAFGAFVTISAGVGPLVGRATGAVDGATRGRAIGTALVVAMGIAVATALCALVGAHWVPGLLGLEGEEARLTGVYLWWLGVTGGAIAVQPVVEASFNAMGFTRRSMTLQGTAVVLNTALTAVLVLGLGMGIVGAALGTTVTQALVTGIGVVWLRRTAGPASWQADWPMAVRIVRLGLPVGLSTAAYALVYFALIRTTVAPLGQVKGLAVGFSALEAMSWPVFVGWSIAVSSLVARHLGAGQPDEAAKAVRLALPWSLGAGVMTALIFTFGGPWLVRVFSADAVVQQQAVVYAAILAWSQPFVALEALFEGVLLGSGDTRRLAWVTIPLNVLRVPLAWLLAMPLGFGAVGIWWAINLTTMGKAGLKGGLVWRGRWKDVAV